MAMKDSFKKGIANAKTAGIKAGTEKAKAVNFAAEFGKRDIVLGNPNPETVR